MLYYSRSNEKRDASALLRRTVSMTAWLPSVHVLIKNLKKKKSVRFGNNTKRTNNVSNRILSVTNIIQKVSELREL